MIKKFLKTFVVFAAIGSVCLTTNASSITDLQGQKEETKRKKEQAEATVEKLKTEQSDILSAIEECDQQLAQYESDINDIQNKMEELNADIETKKAELEVAKENEEKQYAAMKKRIQYSYENGNVGVFDSIFGSKDISEMINKSEYVDQVYNYDKNMLTNLISIKNTIDQCEKDLEVELKQAEKLEEELIDSKDAIDSLKSGKETQYANFEASIDEYEEQIAQYVKDMEATDAAIAAAEAAAQAAYEVPVNYTGGTFQWPVSSGGIITSTFGARWGTIHQGLDIACPEGTPILAGESGVVIISQYSGSAGNFVMIDHGNGVCTVYMHNSQLVASVGQTVNRGDVIAYSGNTGFSTGPHCHFGVRINGSYVDPQPYL